MTFSTAESKIWCLLPGQPVLQNCDIGSLLFKVDFIFFSKGQRPNFLLEEKRAAYKEYAWYKRVTKRTLS
jgi:hypothetical protein